MDDKSIASLSEVMEFGTLISRKIATYIESKSADLRGDENVYFILNEIRNELESGRWRDYINEED